MRTEELAEANTLLQEEMWEKDVARRKLDEQNEKMLQDLTARSQRATLLAQTGELLQSCRSKDEVFARCPRLCSQNLSHQSRGRTLAESRAQPG